jgi:hypothetical protein
MPRTAHYHTQVIAYKLQKKLVFGIWNCVNFALGDRIMPNGDPYRIAFDSANSELNEILGAFEELRARKERIEKVVMALKPLLGAEEAAAGNPNPSDSSTDPGSSGEDVPSYQYQATNGSSPDPFQRRIDSVLGHGGSGSREPRKFNRAL